MKKINDAKLRCKIHRKEILSLSQKVQALHIGGSFSSVEIVKIKGRQSSEIEKILGYISKTEVVHKDDMVKL